MDAVLIVGIVFFTFYKIIELSVLSKGRKLMIEKMNHLSPEDLQMNLKSLHAGQCNKMHGNQFSSLRWGALAMGAGIGWLAGWLLNMHIQYNMPEIHSYYSNHSLDSVIIATTALFAGIALIIVYFIERKAYKAKEE
jgi:hypothetical protein